MNKRKQPAFPAIDVVSGDNYNPPTQVYYTGMTLRDYFAAKAIQGILANPDISASAARCDVTTDDFRKNTVEAAYAIAAAMMIERGGSNGTS